MTNKPKTIATTRKNGFAYTEVLETSGVSSVAVCIRDPAGRPLAAMSVSSITPRLSGPRVAECVESLREAVREIELRLPLTSLAPTPP